MNRTQQALVVWILTKVQFRLLPEMEKHYEEMREVVQQAFA